MAKGGLREEMAGVLNGHHEADRAPVGVRS